MPGDAVDRPERQDRETERDRDRETTEAWDGPRMVSTATRHVEQPETLGEAAHERRDGGRKKECDKSGADEEEAGHLPNDSRRRRSRQNDGEASTE